MATFTVMFDACVLYPGFCRNFYLRRFEVSSSSLSNRALGGRATMAIDCKGAHFPPEVILMGVRWYVAYPLSTRHVEELMEERGVEVDYSTIQRWGVKDSPPLEEAFHRCKQLV